MCTDYQKIKLGNRCSCDFVHTYNMQCCHEICIHSKFKLDLFSSRWFNDLTFNKLNTNGERLLNYNRMINEGCNYSNSIDCSTTCVDENVVATDECEQLPKQQISYQSIKTECETLLKLIQHQPDQMESFNTTVISSIARARDGSCISTYFGTQVNNCDINQQDHSNSTAVILPAKIGNNNNSSKMVRKKSRFETRNIIAKKRARNSIVHTNL